MDTELEQMFERILEQGLTPEQRATMDTIKSTKITNQ